MYYFLYRHRRICSFFLVLILVFSFAIYPAKAVVVTSSVIAVSATALIASTLVALGVSKTSSGFNDLCNDIAQSGLLDPWRYSPSKLLMYVVGGVAYASRELVNAIGEAAASAGAFTYTDKPATVYDWSAIPLGSTYDPIADCQASARDQLNSCVSIIQGLFSGADQQFFDLLQDLYDDVNSQAAFANNGMVCLGFNTSTSPVDCTDLVLFVIAAKYSTESNYVNKYNFSSPDGLSGTCNLTNQLDPSVYYKRSSAGGEISHFYSYSIYFSSGRWVYSTNFSFNNRVIVGAFNPSISFDSMAGVFNAWGTGVEQSVAYTAGQTALVCAAAGKVGSYAGVEIGDNTFNPDWVVENDNQPSTVKDWAQNAVEITIDADVSPSGEVEVVDGIPISIPGTIDTGISIDASAGLDQTGAQAGSIDSDIADALGQDYIDIKQEIEAEEEATASIEENQSVVTDIIEWVYGYIDPDRGAFSKFPLSIPYDLYLLFTALGGYSVSDTITTATPGSIPSVSGLTDRKYSSFTPVFVVDTEIKTSISTIPIEFSIDLTPYAGIISLVRSSIGIVYLIGIIWLEYRRIQSS